MDDTIRDSLSSNNGQTESFQVYVRLRPNSNEGDSPPQQPFLRSNGDRLYVMTNSHERRERKYEFNRVFPENRNNNDVF
jgi:hypothetical protein